MWSDNEADIDLLGFQHLENAVLSIVRDDSLLPATIGIFGDWGSGKSSLMRMVRETLERDADEGVLVLSFNGWLFEGYEDAKTALMGTIIDEVIARRTLGSKAKEQTKRLGYKLLKKIQIFRLLGIGARAAGAYAMGGAHLAGAAVAVEGTAYVADQFKAATDAVQAAEGMDIGKLEEALKSEAGNSLRRSIREFRDEFGELLKQTDVKTLVVLIDDLDRCMPDTIIETLEAIKLFLFVPRTAFIIGADERLVRYAVRRRFPELTGEKVDVGQDYLEKLVQYPVRVPPLGRAEMETYINLLFTKKAQVTSEHFEAAASVSSSVGRKTYWRCDTTTESPRKSWAASFRTALATTSASHSASPPCWPWASRAIPVNARDSSIRWSCAPAWPNLAGSNSNRACSQS